MSKKHRAIRVYYSNNKAASQNLKISKVHMCKLGPKQKTMTTLNKSCVTLKTNKAFLFLSDLSDDLVF